VVDICPNSEYGDEMEVFPFVKKYMIEISYKEKVLQTDIDLGSLKRLLAQFVKHPIAKKAAKRSMWHRAIPDNDKSAKYWSNKIDKLAKYIQSIVVVELGLSGFNRRLQISDHIVWSTISNIFNGTIEYPKDLMTYPAGYAKYIAEHGGDYVAPKWVKKLKHPLKLDFANKLPKDDKVNANLKSKWQWLLYLYQEYDVLYKGEARHWQLAKEVGLIRNARASWSNVTRLCTSLDDYVRNLVPEYHIYSVPYNRVNLGLAELIRRTAAWHEQKHFGKYGEYDMPQNGCPESLEKYRIKTATEMRDAGTKFKHCIGSYADPNSKHIFFKKDTVCAQIIKTEEGNWIINQCFDACNETTPKSNRFKALIARELIKSEVSQKTTKVKFEVATEENIQVAYPMNREDAVANYNIPF
jgi:hypothetical protein